MNMFSKYLYDHQKKENQEATHTRIGDKKSNIYGGAYCIEPHNLERFLELYYKEVFIDKKQEFLTEKQIKNGPILVDFDFRYDLSITKRQHDEETIITIIDLYSQKLKNEGETESKKPFDVLPH